MPNPTLKFFTSFSSTLLMTIIGGVVGLGLGCSSPEEVFDNVDSRVQCNSYCDKIEACGDEDVDQRACVSDCRSSIEDECGNDNQAAANDRIGECTDKGCTEFYACMVFEVAPECFSFVD